MNSRFSGVGAPVAKRSQVIKSGGQRVFDLRVPAGTALLELQIDRFDGTGYVDALSDLDLFVLRDDNGDGFDFEDLVDQSVREFGSETTGILNPPPGVYRVLVDGYFVVGDRTTFDFTHWIVPVRPAVFGTGPRVDQVGGSTQLKPGENGTLRLHYSGVGTAGTNLAVMTFTDNQGATAKRLLQIVYAPTSP